jgi:hypothetical protein
LAIELSASIFCARLMRGTISIAMTVAPFLAAVSSPASLPPGLKNEIRVCPSRNRFSSVSVGTRTLATTSLAFHSAAAVLMISTPASS